MAAYRVTVYGVVSVKTDIDVDADTAAEAAEQAMLRASAPGTHAQTTGGTLWTGAAVQAEPKETGPGRIKPGDPDML